MLSKNICLLSLVLDSRGYPAFNLNKKIIIGAFLNIQLKQNRVKIINQKNSR